ncbi:hypothetical protein [Nostoc sp. TCL26-01]|uniref:hypothetical protein n=1 Tax=Nostoc sp. TCL26-01 TaxID=2576904 RepID=UPI0015B8A8F5|nr:hypothetical protein [Nostoc sp. TCL26-01]QLE56360.1 hypothetical protein FD725_12930 [Nostoc sp. TCL26-01]
MALSLMVRLFPVQQPALIPHLLLQLWQNAVWITFSTGFLDIEKYNLAIAKILEINQAMS